MELKIGFQYWEVFCPWNISKGFISQCFTKGKQNVKMIKMILKVFLCFLLTFLPVTLINIFDPKVETSINLHIFADVLWWSASVINPIIYISRNKIYRDAMISLCRKISCLPEPKKKNIHSTMTPKPTSSVEFSKSPIRATQFSF